LPFAVLTYLEMELYFIGTYFERGGTLINSFKQFPIFCIKNPQNYHKYYFDIASVTYIDENINFIRNKFINQTDRFLIVQFSFTFHLRSVIG
jgi:hypothetical protein